MPKKAAKTGNGAALKPGIYRQRLMPTRTVAVCTLHSADLVDKVAAKKPRGLAVVGLMRTENLGIERIIENICANQNIHSLVVCGEDTGGRIGHFPGQTFIALMENGVDAKKKIVGAKGKRPVLKNLPDDVIDYSASTSTSKTCAA
ncbi:MAG: hypothetical protein M5R36_16720 [Deltaproteobacteria bacterium]|nr:hypothetical protein [Deltaproteobacteria bacterium]